MPTINTKDSPEFKTVKLIYLAEDSIDHIAEAVVSKLDKSVKDGHWIVYDIDHKRDWAYKCSVCGNCACEEWNYCPYCGAKMDESTIGQVKPSDGERKEIEAIPIEWINKWVNDYCDTYQANLIECLLRTWRKVEDE